MKNALLFLKGVILIPLFLLVSAASYGQYSITGITASPASPAAMISGQDVFINFNYSKAPGNVRIFLLPMFGGNPAAGYAVSGSPLYTANSGTGSGSITLNNGGNVNQIRVQIVDATNNTLLYQTFFGVNYTFFNYRISGISLSTASPATLISGTDVFVSFNYQKKAGSVRIFLLPMNDGLPAPGYAVSGSPLYTGSSGNTSGSITLNNGGSVDQIRFQVVDANTNAVVYETFYAVNYTFINYKISGISLSTASPATLISGTDVFVSFNYQKKAGSVRIFLLPMNDGLPAQGYAVSGSPLYTASSGNTSGSITLNNGGSVDQIRFQVVDANTNAVVYETFYAVNYTFINYKISGISLSPTSPASLTAGTDVFVSFNYQKKAGSVRIFLLPMNDGLPAPGYAVSGSPLYTASSGNTSGSITLNNGGTVDQIRFQIVDANTNAVLFETFYNVNYTFTSYKIFGISTSPSSPRTMISGENVSISFSYTKKEGDVRIFARPFYNGNPAPGYGASGSPVYTANSGTATGTFTLSNGGAVDSIRFQIYNVAGTLLYQTFYAVNYTFINYRISGLALSPTSPRTLTSGENLSLSFNYGKKSGDVRIFARPMNDGNLAPGYGASGSPVYTANSGSGTGTFTLSNGGSVDQIRFQVVDVATNEVVYETFYTVNYTFVNYRIFGIGVSPSSPATLTSGNNVSISFSYGKINGDVRIFARPMNDGNLAPGYGASGSPVYTANSGTGTGTFMLSNGGDVDQIRFQMIDASTGAVLYQTFYNVNYTFVNYRIFGISVSPSSPDTLTSGSNVSISFSYGKVNGDVRIFARPMNDGNLAPGYGASGSPVYTANNGTGSGTFSLFNGGNVDQIRFQMVDATTGVVLHQTFYNVNYTFVNYSIFGIGVSPASPVSLTIGSNVSIAFSYGKITGDVRIFARPMSNGSLAAGYGASGSPVYTANSGTGSGTFTLYNGGIVDQVRFQIVDVATNAVVYEMYIPVNIMFKNVARAFDDSEESAENTSAAISLDVAPVPADEELTLSTGLESFMYRISDMTGNTVKTGTSETYSKTLDVRELSAGMYILQIQSGDIIREKKIIIK